MHSLFLVDELCTYRDLEEREEAGTVQEHLLLNSLLGNERVLCCEPACEHSPFASCSAHLQLRWYGLRSMFMSDIDKLPLKTQWIIASAAPVPILFSFSSCFQDSNVVPSLCVCRYAYECYVGCMFWEGFI